MNLKARSKEWHKRKVKVTQKMITGGCCTDTIERKLTLENVKMESYWKGRKEKMFTHSEEVVRIVSTDI